MEHQIFDMEFPSQEGLLDYATQQAPLRHTTTKKHCDCLRFLVESYLTFVKERDLPEYLRRFWISDPRMTKFPEEDFKKSLKRFFSAENLWSHPYIEYMRHEHLRILFFIAALRYRGLQEPQQQIKFKEENPSEGGIIDLFLFDKDQASPVYGLQVRLLTPYDLDSQGRILKTNRTSGFFDQGIDNFNEYMQNSQIILTSSLYALGSQSSQEAKTHGCVVLVTPYNFEWLNCGRYTENLTSKLYDENSSRQPQQRNQANTSSNRGFYERKKKNIKSKTKSPISYAQKLQYSPIPSQDFNSYHGINTSIPAQPLPQPMFNPYQPTNQPYFNPENGGLSNQAFPQSPFFQHSSHGIPFPHVGYGFQTNLIPPMLVMSNPNFLPFYNNPYNYQGFLEEEQQQMLAGVRMNPVNGWKERGYY